jgi:hypothetical protein
MKAAQSGIKFVGGKAGAEVTAGEVAVEEPTEGDITAASDLALFLEPGTLKVCSHLPASFVVHLFARQRKRRSPAGPAMVFFSAHY